MIKSSFMFQLADTLSKQMGKAPLASVTPVSMYPDEQGYSGAELVRHSFISILHWYNTTGDPLQDWTVYCPFFV